MFDFLAGNLLGVEGEILEASRLGMIIMTPWDVGHRAQAIQPGGVLIRFGQSKAVGWGTLVRLIADVSVLFTCYTLAQLFESPNPASS